MIVVLFKDSFKNTGYITKLIVNDV